MLDLYVDADACPVKDEVYRVAERCGLKVYVVANVLLRVPTREWIEAVVVKGSADAADDWIAEHVQEDDIVVSADIPLADRCLKKGAHVLGSKGQELTPETIGSAMASRALMEHLRGSGETTGGPSAFTPKDRSRFLSKLDAMIHKVRRRRTTGRGDVAEAPPTP